MASRDARIDAYISAASPVAQPVLKNMRDAVHAACPDVQETIKWRFPTFEHQGILCGMGAFKKYTGLGFWKSKALASRLPVADRKVLKQIGEVRPGDSMPSRAAFVRIVKAAMRLNEEGIVEKRAMKKKPPVRTPAAFLSALKNDPRALAAYRALPPSHKREYVEWIAGAKQDETRQRRIAQAIAWIADGKARNWKYETKDS